MSVKPISIEVARRQDPILYPDKELLIHTPQGLVILDGNNPVTVPLPVIPENPVAP